jgi:hypothetical protein
MYLVIRRGAIATLDRAGELAGAAAVRCVRTFADDPRMIEWRRRPGKVTLRARGGQWAQVLAEPHALSGDPDGEAVVALPPRRRSERGELLERMQAMASELDPPPAEVAGDDDRWAVTYVLNPAAPMSSGKTVAQVAHAAVAAAERRPDWEAAGCPGRVIAPSPARFAEILGGPDLVARIEDAGLTEVAPGTTTVLALAPEAAIVARG